jgi:hypothetical protein
MSSYVWIGFVAANEMWVMLLLLCVKLVSMPFLSETVLCLIWVLVFWGFRWVSIF